MSNNKLVTPKQTDFVNNLSKTDLSFLPQIVDLIPFFVYWKDKNGKYLGVNKHASLGMSHPEQDFQEAKHEIIGKTGHDIFNKTVADQYSNNDILVFNNKKLLITQETACSTEKKIIEISIKSPLVNEKGKIVGILGISKPAFEIFTQTKLSMRETECCQLLVKGFTYKQIANELGISNRTVETHIQNIKHKLGCYSRSSLINKFMNYYNEMNPTKLF